MPRRFLPFRLRNRGFWWQKRAAAADIRQRFVQKKLVASLSLGGFDAKVEVINHVNYSSFISRAKLHSFYICGDTNLKYAWLGARRVRINAIISHGFSIPNWKKPHGYDI